MRTYLLILVSCVVVSFNCDLANANLVEDVDNWKAIDQPLLTTSGLNTNSPTMGDGTESSGEGTLLAKFDNGIFLEVGDFIEVTGHNDFDPDSTNPFLYSMRVTRDSATTVDILSTFGGGDGGPFGSFFTSFARSDFTTSFFTYTTTGWFVSNQT